MIYLETGCRAALAFVFLVASTSKIHSVSSYREFHDSLKDLGLSSSLLLRALSLGIPAAEGVTAILLAVNRTSLWGLFASVVLLGSFTTGIAVARAQGKVVRCRCFGESGAPSEAAHILRNLVLFAGAVTGALAGFSSNGRPEPAMVVFAIGLGIIAAALFLRWDELSFLLKPSPSPRAGG
jgi:hypothetical protein